MASIDVQKVGDGVLATIDGATIHFHSAADAVDFGLALVKVATLGADVLDDIPRESTGH